MKTVLREVRQMNGYKELAARYFPVTAFPLRCDSTYAEVLPSAEMRPFIRCFWGSSMPVCEEACERSQLVIPDTCMDIIIRQDMTTGRTVSAFCAADSEGYYTESPDGGPVRSVFGIRFYAWTAAMFTDRPFDGSMGIVYDPDDFFAGLRAELMTILESTESLDERAKKAEAVLYGRLDTFRVRADLMNAVYDTVISHGRARLADLAEKSALSGRQLERIFSCHTGISPKTFCSLIRYQMLWQDIFFGRGSLLDLTERYGYSDQAHLLNDFRRRHLMTPSRAFEAARR